MPGILFGTISGGKIHDEYHLACHAWTQYDLRNRKQYGGVAWGRGAFHANNRNNCCEQFLKGQCEHLLFIDSDIEFKPQDVYAMVDACRGDKKVVTGLYFIYHPETTLNPCWFRKNNLTGSYDTYADISGGLHQIDACGAGFLCIHRDVIEKIKELRRDIDDPWIWFGHDLAKMVVSGQYKTGERVPFKNTRLGEDMTFCGRAQAAGFTVWGLGDVVVNHIKERRENLNTYMAAHGFDLNVATNEAREDEPKFERVVREDAPHADLPAPKTDNIAIEKLPD